ncbi:MAG: 50S ribosomal protein L15 [bacterium]
MALSLHTISPAKGSKEKRFRIGRGTGSGIGTTAGRGTKGQRARTGGRGGLKMMGLKRTFMKFPKFKGMKPKGLDYTAVNTGDLERLFNANQIVTPKALRSKGLVSISSRKIKLLGKGKLTKPLIIQSVAVSASAKLAIEKAGGTIQ